MGPGTPRNTEEPQGTPTQSYIFTTQIMNELAMSTIEDNSASTHPSDDPDEDDRKPAAKRIKKEPEDDAQSVTQDEPKVETIVKPWEDKKDYEAIFRKYIYIGNDGEEHYDVIDMERDAQRAVKRDHRPSRNSQTIPKSGEGI